MAAEHFGLVYVDTGALYRCVGLYILRSNADPNNGALVESLLPDMKIEISYDGVGSQRMFLCGEDVSESIRMHIVSTYASDASAIPAVRNYLLSTQREMAVRHDVIMDGRDIGTVILPNAGLKVFLTADPEIRAKRRYLELLGKNVDTTLQTVYEDMVTRDKNDSGRSTAPLKVAEDSVVLDTTYLNLDESFGALCEIIAGRLKKCDT